MQSIILPRPARRNRRRHTRARSIIGRALLLTGLVLVTLAAVRCTLNP